MKLRWILALAVAFLFLAGLESARAQSIIIDELGNGRFAGQSVTGSLMADPSNPGGPMALTYLLPPLFRGGTTGDVIASEPAAAAQVSSDVLRFTDANGSISGSQTADRIIFYSDTAGGVDALADTGFPTNVGTGIVSQLTETGPEGNNSFLYAPSNTPFVLAISDGSFVPEPSGFALLGLGALGLAGYAWRRRRQMV